MKLSTRNGVRFFSLLLILVLWASGKAHIWGPLLGIGLLVIPLWGRIYCGWICPISTSIDIIHPLIKKPLFKANKDIFLNRYLQGLLIIFYGIILAAFIKTSFVVPFFIFLIPIGLIVTYLWGEVFWHRFCPFGIMYGWIGQLAKRGYFLHSENCARCRVCVSRCPNECIFDDNDDYRIDNKHCLSCGKCKDNCPETAIQYGKLKHYLVKNVNI